MGYSKSLDYGDNFQIGGVFTSVVITTTPTDKVLGTITTPSDMVVKKAYLDLSIRAISSSSGGAFNWLNGNVPYVAVLGGLNKYSWTFASECLYTFGDGISPGAYLYGQNELTEMFKAGEVTQIRLNAARALGNNLVLWDVQPVVRMILA